jgi:hypothetical protein
MKDKKAGKGAGNGASQAAAPAVNLEAPGPPLVDYHHKQLRYRTYAACGDDHDDDTKAVHRIPDFSWAGYRQGGVALPTPLQIPVVETIDGPLPGGADNRQMLQAAIDRAGALERSSGGWRGAVLVRRGVYPVSDTLVIQTSGVVLRGEGQGPEDTRIVATAKTQIDCLIRVAGTSWKQGDKRSKINSPLVPVGATSFVLNRISHFKVGDSVGIQRKPNQAWLDALDMAQYGWTTKAYTIIHPRTVVAVDEATSTITLDIPVVDAIDERYGGGSLFSLEEPTTPTVECGVEDLRLESTFHGKKNKDEDHCWNGILLAGVQNCWVRRVTTKHFGFSAVQTTERARFNTIEEVASLEPVSKLQGGRRYSFCVSDAVGTLFQRCFCEDGRHDFVTGSRVTGPHVWLDCISARANADSGPHHRWATGLLFDNVSTKLLRVQDRKDSGSGHGWAGAQVLFWNATVTEGQTADGPPGSMNWSIGTTGPVIPGKYTHELPTDGWLESHDQPISKPRSLYLQQLSDRLGHKAVKAVTTSRQRKAAGDGPTFYEQLMTWAGNGRLPSDD